MSINPPGRPKGEDRSAQREGLSINPQGRPKGEDRSAQREGAFMSAPAPKRRERSSRREPSPGSRIGFSETLPGAPRDNVVLAIARKFGALSLFWRTFFLLSLLLAASVVAWLQTFRALEFERRAAQSAQQISGLVELTRSALQSSDAINRVVLARSISKLDAMKLVPKRTDDRWEPYETDRESRAIEQELRSQLGTDSTIARSVNGVPGVWVAITVDGQSFWLKADPPPVGPMSVGATLLWVGIALGATVLGSAAIAGLINRPLKALSFAATRIGEGEYDSRLDETIVTSEIRQVNMGFNRMARELAKVEQDRAVMLAGISHDLRTPLARLRLEAEMSVQDEEAKANIALDIDQLDAIIDKFMDYARPGDVKLVSVNAAVVVSREAAAFRDTSQMRISSKVASDARVLADDVELGRVMQNLFENARRYGRSTDTGIARVLVTSARVDSWVILTIRDHGQGVDPAKLDQLTTPFFRGDAARTAATGAGLGLAIVEKAVQRMGGALELANAADGGLLAHVRLKRAT